MSQPTTAQRPPLGAISDLILRTLSHDPAEQTRLLDWLRDQYDARQNSEGYIEALKKDIRKFTDAAQEFIDGKPADTATEDVDRAVGIFEEHSHALRVWLGDFEG